MTCFRCPKSITINLCNKKGVEYITENIKDIWSTAEPFKPFNRPEVPHIPEKKTSEEIVNQLFTLVNNLF